MLKLGGLAGGHEFRTSSARSPGPNRARGQPSPVHSWPTAPQSLKSAQLGLDQRKLERLGYLAEAACTGPTADRESDWLCSQRATIAEQYRRAQVAYNEHVQRGVPAEETEANDE